MLDGTQVPCEVLGKTPGCLLIWGHGLGPSAPREMSRRTCESFELIREAVGLPPDEEAAVGEAAHGERPAGEEVAPGSDSSLRVVLYDARGHGTSAGWERTATQIQQFHWKSLAFDMLTVAAEHRDQSDRREDPGVLLGGYSMGASTALWAAYLYPTAVKGLVLLCVTTAWEIRAGRRGNLLANAEALAQGPDPASAEVVRGAAFADLPTEAELKAADLRMPVLLMCARDDGTHPAAVIERLSALLPNSQTVIADTTEDLRQRFPRTLQRWTQEHFAAGATAAS